MPKIRSRQERYLSGWGNLTNIAHARGPVIPPATDLWTEGEVSFTALGESARPRQPPFPFHVRCNTPVGCNAGLVLAPASRSKRRWLAAVQSPLLDDGVRHCQFCLVRFHAMIPYSSPRNDDRHCQNNDMIEFRIHGSINGADIDWCAVVPDLSISDKDPGYCRIIALARRT